MTTAAWRIDEHSGFLWCEAAENRWEPLFNCAGDELAVGEVACGGVGSGGKDGATIVFDAREGNDSIRQFDGEEPDAAIGIDQVLNAAVSELLRDRLDEAWQQMEIVLEKGVWRHFPVVRWKVQGDLQSTAWRRVGSELTQFLI
jgi:hypothetical protein